MMKQMVLRIGVGVLVGFGLVLGGYRAGMDHPPAPRVSQETFECENMVAGVKHHPDGSSNLIFIFTMNPFQYDD